MKNLSKKQKTTVVIIVLCILITLTVIFGNSMKSMEESGNQSQEVVDIIKPIIDADNSISDNDFEFGIRKLAHLFEFTVLSFELMLLYFTMNKKLPVFLHSSLLCFFVAISALTDETIQIFSGRGTSVVDVWIDLTGGLLGILFFTVIFYSSKFLKKRFQKVDKR